MRNLAQRSAAAAKEIKTLISDSVDKVEQGSKLAGDTGQVISEVVSSVKRVSDVVSEISAASVEQSAGIEQVNTAITHMDEVTQQNAALVEQASAAAESLEEQASTLTESVGVFRIRTAARSVATLAVGSPRDSLPPPMVQPAARKPAARTSLRAPAGQDDDEWKDF